jgi:hypothetical protein
VRPPALRSGLLVDVVQSEAHIVGVVPKLLPHPRLHVPQVVENDAGDVHPPCEKERDLSSAWMWLSR